MPGTPWPQPPPPSPHSPFPLHHTTSNHVRRQRYASIFTTTHATTGFVNDESQRTSTPDSSTTGL